MKKKQPLKDALSFLLEGRQYVTYADYAYGAPLFTKAVLSNAHAEAVEGVTVTFSDDGSLLAANEQHIPSVPFEGGVEIDTAQLLNPVRLSSLTEAISCKVTVRAAKGEETLCAAEHTFTVLPYDYYAGVQSRAELLCGMIRPRLARSRRALAAAADTLKGWGLPGEFNGYERNKNVPLKQFAAIYAAVKKEDLRRKEADLSQPLQVAAEGDVLTELDVCLLVASHLETAELHPLLLLGKEAAVGVWLYEGCFSSPVTDDLSVIENYTASGVNNLCFVRGRDLFADSEGSFATACARFGASLREGAYEYCLDVRRARLGGYFPLPVKRGEGEKYELLTAEALSEDEAPAEISDVRLSIDAKLPKNKQWERRLLDLSFKNPLLHFNEKRNAVPLLSCGLDAFYVGCAEKGSLALVPSDEEMRRTLSGKKNVAELVELELAGGAVRSLMAEDELAETVSRIVRKGREADEESGGNLIYLALGFLRYVAAGNELRAPLLLFPVRIGKNKGNTRYTIETTKDSLQVNTTLLEYLKQEHNIDIRGLDNSLEGLRLSEILAMVRSEIADMKGWKVDESVYLSVFSFTRYFMWNDVRRNIEAFRRSEVVSALLDRRPMAEQKAETRSREEYEPFEVLTPLVADESQFGAVALSGTGASFVLHGPPGTGKSQTITNMIANALRKGKRVLFVAEKQAALSVVQRRLEGIGIGDFCLELHSSRADKGEILRKIEATMELSDRGDDSFEADGERVSRVERDIKRVVDAMHKERRIGVSVYGGIVRYLANKDAPDILGIDSVFYDTLTKRKIERCEELLLSAAYAAKDCGGVSNVPFENVNLDSFSAETKDEVYCAGKALLAEIAHLKEYLRLFTLEYRQTVSVVTAEKLRKLREIAKTLYEGKLREYFSLPEEEFQQFFRANLTLDENFAFYFAKCRKLVDIEDECDALERALENWDDSSIFERPVRAVIKKLDRVSAEKIPYGEYKKYLEVLVSIERQCEMIRKYAPASAMLFRRDGALDLTQRDAYLKDLRALHAQCREVFLDYDADTFNSMCARAVGGSTRSVLGGVMRAADGFDEAVRLFCRAAKIDESKINTDDLFSYFSEKASFLLNNLDKLAGWCRYKKTAADLREGGLGFMVDALESGKVDSGNIVSCFEKHVYRNFLSTFLTGDPILAGFSQAVLDEKIALLKELAENYRTRTKSYLRGKLCARLSELGGDSPVSVEVMNFKRMGKGRNVGLKSVFTRFPELLRRVAPCMLMSPTTVAQFLPAEQIFDLVIFDEASQLPTAEAIGSLGRAKSAIIVGDPNQLPPTSFFSSGYIDEENLENEDLESILDDALAAGMPQRHLVWHYRSRHESLIAFSNAAYYQGRLCTFPSPDGMESRVRFHLVSDGVYDKGFTKRNKAEAEALVAEVVRRLQDPSLSKLSIGVVTFSSVQKDYIERLLNKAIVSNKLEEAAYDREEPVFVKNLENVQGDERDVILFSVCYGPDRNGKISLNFGPLNQAGGWRRLNVAVSRAREEMVLFASMTSAMIDLSKTSSRGVAGLKGFLEFAQRGRVSLAISPANAAPSAGIGRFLAADLAAYGYECRYDVGASSFKIDVGVVDPRHPDRFLLGILSERQGAVYDTCILQPQTLRRADWNIARVCAESYYSNPKREVRRLRELLDKLTGAGNRRANVLRSRHLYKTASLSLDKQDESFFMSGENDKEILAVCKKIVAQEEPVAGNVVAFRCMEAYGVKGERVRQKVEGLLAESPFKREKLLGRVYYRLNDRCLHGGRYRVTETGMPIVTPYDVFALTGCILENRIALPKEELFHMLCDELRIPYRGKMIGFLEDCIEEGEKRGLFLRSVAGRVMLS